MVLDIGILQFKCKK